MRKDFAQNCKSLYTSFPTYSPHPSFTWLVSLIITIHSKITLHVYAEVLIIYSTLTQIQHSLYIQTRNCWPCKWQEHESNDPKNVFLKLYWSRSHSNPTIIYATFGKVFVLYRDAGRCWQRLSLRSEWGKLVSKRPQLLVVVLFQ